MLLEATLAILGVVMLLTLALSLLWRLHAVRSWPRPSKLLHYPSITVIRPIKGLDAGAAENIRAALAHGYPGPVQTIFVFDDDCEPALPLVRGAIEQHRREHPTTNDRMHTIFCGPPPPQRTGKLNAMIAGLKAAEGELIAFVDSDVRQDDRALRVLVESLMTADGAGSAFAPVVVTEAPQTVGDAGYALMLNGFYGPAAAASARAQGGELPFIMGQFMAFKREAIMAIGGLETAEGQLVDDMYLGMRLNQEGYRNVMSPHSVAIIQRGCSLRTFAGILVRWITFSRSGLPALSFKLASWMLGVMFWSGFFAALLALSRGLTTPAVLTALAPMGVSVAINVMHRALGGAKLPLKYWWVSFALCFTAPAVYLTIFNRQQVSWRGRRYQLNTGSRLA